MELAMLPLKVQKQPHGQVRRDMKVDWMGPQVPTT